MSAGWATSVEGLGENVRAKIADGKLPASLNVAAVEAAAARFGALRADSKAMAPSGAAKQANSLIRRIVELQTELQDIPAPLRKAVSVSMAHGGKPRPVIKRAADALGEAARALELARREIEAAPKRDGRPPGRRAWLVLELAAIVEKAGGTADDKSDGALVELTAVVMRALDERVTNFKQVVGTALKLRR